jgi:hypothetical protein
MQVLTGILLLIRFRAEGLALFTPTPAGFLNSLAPMIAITLVAGMRPLLAGNYRLFVLHVLSNVIALLTPAVTSHFLARIWGREARWLRYAVAMNWCHAALSLPATLILLAFAADSANGMVSGMPALLTVAFAAYWFVFSCFLARRGLDVTRSKAVLAVLIPGALVTLIVTAPLLLRAAGA